MKYNLIFFFISVLYLISCGVKNDPVNPTKDRYPSIIDDYQTKVKNKHYGGNEFGSGARK